jgi:diguanylate cyclase (GGDEF)-like protein
MRILVADDDSSVQHAYRLCLENIEAESSRAIDALGASLFGEAKPVARFNPRWDSVDLVSQGEAAVEMVRQACVAGAPYGVLFLDMLMPPGIDGRETAKRIRVIDPDINIVIVTGYSDHSPADVSEVAGPEDKIYFLAKPFETLEIQTLANSLAAKWVLERELRQARADLTAQVAALEEANTALAASEARCRHIAMHDQLTHLPNRTAFQQFLDERLARTDLDIAVMFVDLDRFKHINDTLGHAAGDELICMLSRRLSAALPEGSMLARLGGDEFGIVLTGTGAVDCREVANRLVATCADQFQLLGAQVQIGASVGTALRDCPTMRTTELLRRADLALYAAKNRGRNRAEMFLPMFDDSARKRSEIETRLRHALANDTLTLAYQPIHDPSVSVPVGYEALLRWEDEVLGTLSPGLFVPIAEETGLITELGEWVIRNAIAACAEWPSGYVSLNLSTRHFQSPAMIECLLAEARRHNVPHGRIQLEITEAALFDDAALAAGVLIKLRGHGFRIALDDFGTGYSSLVNLKDFQIDCIKIDQSYVANLGSDTTSSAIVMAVTSLARALGLKVVAEGVENETQVQALRLTGCELMQGFFFSGAVDSDDLFDAGRGARIRA